MAPPPAPAPPPHAPPPAPVYRIYCTADAEPAGFHNREDTDTSAAYALNLNFEVVADPTGSDVVKNAKKFFDWALGAAKSFKFFLYEPAQSLFQNFDPKQNSLQTFDPKNSIPGTNDWHITPLDGKNGHGDVLSAPLADPDPLRQWLHAGAKFKQRNEAAFWLVAPVADRPLDGQPKPPKPITESQIGATHELRAAHSWNAPVGHTFALTHVARGLPVPAAPSKPAPPAKPPPQKSYYVLPYIGEAPPKPADIWVDHVNDSQDHSGETVDFRYKLEGVANEISVRVSRLLPPDQGGLAVVETDGFLKVDLDQKGKASNKYRRLLNAFEEQAATLVSPAIALTQISAIAAGDKRESKPGDPPWRVAIWELFKPHWSSSKGALWRPDPKDPLKKDHQNKNNPAWIGVADDSAEVWFTSAPEAAWLAVTALCVALDPITIALLYPGSASAAMRPEGQLLSVLVSAILNALDDDTEPTASEIAQAVRNFLGHSPLCDKNQWQNASTLVEALRHVHDLPANDDASAGPETLVEVLLKLFVLSSIPVADWKMPTPAQFQAVAAVAATKDGKTPPGGLGPDIMAAASTSGRRLHDEGEFEKAILRFFETATKAYQVSPKDIVTVPQCIAIEVVKVASTNDPKKKEKIKTAVETAWRNFGSALGGTFNGAEAARRSAGADFVVSLVKPPLAAAPDKAKALHECIVNGSAYAASLFAYAARLGGASSTGCFDDIFVALPRPQPPPAALWNQHKIVPPDKDYQKALDSYLKQLLDAALSDGLAPLAHFVDPTPRFIPDAVPHPLAIQIADDMSPEQAEAFAHRFNGVAVVLRRLDTEDSPFAHLNLAELTWSRENDDFSAKADIPAALHPILPSVADGRSPLFINYEGFPFASTAFHETIPFADDGPDARRLPFYKYDVATIRDADNKPGPAKDYAPAPQLAYGRTFEYAAFVVSNSGAMPKPLRKSDAESWLPLAKVDKDDATIKSRKAQIDCQRRTAVGRVAVSNESSARQIGAPIAGVHPLANDYPRLALTAERGSPGVVDLMRLIDGSGALEVAAPPVDESPAQRTVQLDDVDWIGGSGRLKVLLYGHPADLTDPAIPGWVEVQISEPVPRKLSISVTAETSADQRTTWSIDLVDLAEGARVGKANVPPPSAGESPYRFWWLRLVLSTDDDKPVTLSFAEPEPALGASHGVRDAPLLLLSTPNSAVWVHKSNAKVAAPRTGFLDFERWFANPDLLDIDPRFKKLLYALLSAYIVRHADRQLADSLANLPDPSVAKLRFRLMPADRLGKVELPRKLQRIIDLPPISSGVSAAALDELAQDVKAAQTDDKAQREQAERKWIADLLSLVVNLNKHFTFDLVFQASDDGKLGIDPADDHDPLKPTTVTVPAGVVAHLEIAPLVEHKHFKQSKDNPPVFDEGMLQYAVDVEADGVGGDCIVFPATMIRIETMTDRIVTDYLGQAGPGRNELTAFIKMMTAAAPSGSARRYDVVTATAVETVDNAEQQLALRSAWRINGEIDTTTQRWRPMGRPIHFFPDPRVLADKSNLDRFSIEDNVLEDSTTCLRQVARASDKDGPDLVGFEREIFFDRPNIDSQTVTQKIAPLPAPTVLHTVVWDAPSATYFRHRFTLRTRYGRTDTQTWSKNAPRARNAAAQSANEDLEADRKYEEWTLRVAVLADMSRLTITRPQLRALMPLTTTPVAEGSAIARPPTLAILQEPPFGRGGLAERLGAELGLVFAYKFDTEDPREQIHIYDSGKQIGPYPTSNYRPFHSSKALGMTLRVEGPLGLTFDDLNAPSPAFPNSLAILSLDSVMGETPRNLEQYLLGVSLRRWLDPNWTVRAATAVNRLQSEAGLDPDLCWWADLPPGAVTGAIGDCDNNGDYTIYIVDADSAGSSDTKTAWLTIGFAEGVRSPSTAGRLREIRVAKVAIDPVAVDGQVPIGRFATNSVAKLHLLHQPVAAGRYSTSVLAERPEPHQTDQHRGDGKAANTAPPVLLATFEWSPRQFVKAAKPGDYPTAPPVLNGRLTSRVSNPRPGANPAALSAFRAMASVPTPLVWTVTGRDHCSWRKYDSGNSTAGETVKASELNPIFADAGSSWTLDFGEPWLYSSTLAEPKTGVHVHRRLAVIATRYAEGGGRPVELYCGTALLDGRIARLTKDRSKSPPQLCRLVEFETPAMILTNEDAQAVPATYKSAYFDFKSSLAEDEEIIEFHFRFIGGRDHLKKLNKLTIFLKSPAANAADVSRLAYDPGGGDACPVGLRLRFDSNDGAHSARFLMSDGSLMLLKSSDIASKASDVVAPKANSDGFIMTVQGQMADPRAEFWTDVSVLHSKRKLAEDEFNYDWLFSAHSGQEPTELVRAAELSKMPEAQARIIAISPAIPIKKQ